MYRTVLCVACLGVVSAAPPVDTDSGVTFIKTIPYDRLTDEAHQHRSPFRESRIEILPLTIPGKIDERVKQNISEKAIKNITDSQKKPEISSKNTEINEQAILSEHKLEEANRHVRSEDTTESLENGTTDTTEEALERDEQTEALLRQTEEYESRTKAPAPRFLSKLSYFKNNEEDKSTSIFTNLVERSGKKKFKSKCRCEKIWNCPKLQITVPRCPNEYFLCCFYSETTT